MSWLAVLLIGLAVTDLGHSLRPVRHLPQLVGALVCVVVALLAGLTAPRDLVAVAVIVVSVLAWGHLVRVGFGRKQPRLPLTLLTIAVTLAVLWSPWASTAGGPFAEWVEAAPWPGLAGIDPDRALLAAGAMLVQLSTGNVIVRLVLLSTGTVNPAKDPSRELKGGRLLGPMERLLILGLGMAGHVTAASIVVAAKGLLRFPELQSKRDGPEIDEITEYFLVGSFVSWLIALGTLVLLG